MLTKAQVYENEREKRETEFFLAVLNFVPVLNLFFPSLFGC